MHNNFASRYLLFDAGIQSAREAHPASLAGLAAEFGTSVQMFDAAPLSCDTISFADEVNSLWPADAASLPKSAVAVGGVLLKSSPPPYCTQAALQPSGSATAANHSTEIKQPMQSGSPESLHSDVRNNNPQSLYGHATCDTSAAAQKNTRKRAQGQNNTSPNRPGHANEVPAAGQHKRQKRKAQESSDEDTQEQQTKKARKSTLEVEPAIKEREVVWAKFTNHPHWPAEVSFLRQNLVAKTALAKTKAYLIACSCVIHYLFLSSS